ncbi:hypothetical protein BC833DRAFT_619172 [Globomyces pollinis-pini]|nr:hypothetical protein BC833DRAFT_619172 [Globomyces pollinis-pini]
MSGSIKMRLLLKANVKSIVQFMDRETFFPTTLGSIAVLANNTVHINRRQGPRPSSLKPDTFDADKAAAIVENTDDVISQ